MNEKQQQLTFDKGITNVPSDALCSDNTLEECEGMIVENGEHRPIQRPIVKLTATCRVLFIHKNGSLTRYICLTKGTTTDTLCWGVKSSTAISITANIMTLPQNEVPLVSAVGKTLVVSSSLGMSYFLWKDNTYVELGDVPMPDIDFILVNEGTDWRPSGVDYYQVTNGVINDSLEIRTGQQQAWNDMVVGLYSQNKRLAERECMFVGPFFVRAAVRMYDGSYTKMTAPILMVPTMAENTFGRFLLYDSGLGEDDKLEFFTYASSLKYQLHTNYAPFSDIVDDVTIFVSDQIETLDITGNQKNLSEYFDEGVTWKIYSINKYGPYDTSERREYPLEMTKETIIHTTLEENRYYNMRIPEARTQRAINDDIEDVSLFYKIADIGTAANDEWINIKEMAREHVLETITEQEQLVDEYFGHSKLYAGYMYAYNARLNLADVTRTIFNGFNKFMPYDAVDDSGGIHQRITREYTAYVYVKTDTRTVIVKKVFTTSEKQGVWFYYPDSRAFRVQIFRQGILQRICILNEELTEHKGLNGAYYFRGLPVDADYEEMAIAGVTEPTVDDGVQTEELENTIVTSEVNNPFVFKAEGYNQAGVGKIIAISTNTKALSQGQFGQFPLVIFSDEGIWAMNCDKTGLFISVHPMSREVCNNAQSVTQTDGAIFFSSEKGLMVVVSSEVKCVSEQLSTLPDFLRDAYIAYDYRDSLLWIFNNNVAYRDSCYIYSIKSGTFATYSLSQMPIGNVVNDYPDTLLQKITYDGTTAVYSSSQLLTLMGRPLDHADTRTYAATLKTRPMKLENALALKSIMQVRHVHTLHIANQYISAAGMTFQIFASNNLHDFVELHSLRGTPWKYYKFQFNFTNMLATDRFAGTMLITQERRTNKLR